MSQERYWPRANNMRSSDIEEWSVWDEEQQLSPRDLNSGFTIWGAVFACITALPISRTKSYKPFIAAESHILSRYTHRRPRGLSSHLKSECSTNQSISGVALPDDRVGGVQPDRTRRLPVLSWVVLRNDKARTERKIASEWDHFPSLCLLMSSNDDSRLVVLISSESNFG